jgi:hypothetical protein
MKRMKLMRLSALALVGAVLLAAPGRAGEGAEKAALPPGVPKGAEAWLVLPAPKTSVDRAKKVAEAVMPGTGGMVEMTLQGALAKYGGDALDLTKPAVAVFALGEKPKFATTMGLKLEGDITKALEARFGKATKTEKGVSTYLEVQEGALPDKEVFVCVKKDRMVIGDDARLVGLLAAAAPPAAGDYEAAVDIVAGLDLKAVSTKHKEKLDEFLKKLEAGPAAAVGAPGAGKINPGLEKVVGVAYADFIRAAIKQVDLLNAEVRIGADEVALSLGLKAAKGGDLAASLDEIAKAKLPSVKMLPAKSMVVLAADMDPEVAAKIVDKVKPVLVAGLAAAEGDEKLKKAVEAQIRATEAYIKQSDGAVSEAVFRRKGGLCGVIVCGIKDQAAGRAAMIKAVKTSISGELGKKWQETGVKLELKEKVRKSGDLDVDRLTLDFKPPANKDLPPEMQARMLEMQRKMMEALYGMPINYEIAFHNKTMLTTFGKESPKALDELIARIKAGEGNQAVMAATLKRAPKGSFVVGEADLIEYAYMVIDMIGKAAPMGAMPEIDLGKGPSKPASFWVAAGERDLVVRLNIPVDPIKRIVAAVQKAQQQMMKQVQPPQPVPLPGGQPGIERF